MSIYETSITNPKKQLEFYKQLSKQLQQENKILKENAKNNDKVVDKVNWENQLLKKENKQLKKDVKNIIKILDKNCDDLEATEEEFDSLDKWQGLQVVELEQGSASDE